MKSTDMKFSTLQGRKRVIQSNGLIWWIFNCYPGSAFTIGCSQVVQLSKVRYIYPAIQPSARPTRIASKPAELSM